MPILQRRNPDISLKSVKSISENSEQPLYNSTLFLERRPIGAFADGPKPVPLQSSLTRKTFQLLRMLMENGNRKTVYSYSSNQRDLARVFNVTRQALSIHVKRLRELGMVQVGRGFVNVTESGLRAAGYNTNPVIVTVRLSPQKRLEIFKRISDLPAVEIFRVTGEMDIVLVVEQEKLDEVLGALDQTDGVLETKSLVSIETMK